MKREKDQQKSNNRRKGGSSWSFGKKSKLPHPAGSQRISSLTPKVLTGDAELQTIQPYLDELKKAMKDTHILNIALTGSYGSGKSTILKTFQHQHPEYHYLNITLASFVQTEEEPPIVDLSRQIELSILQQMFYHVKPAQIPDSRFKRIAKLSPGRLWTIAFLMMAWTASIFLLFWFDYLQKLNPATWRSQDPMDWTAVGAGSLFLLGVGVWGKTLYRLFRNSRINKLNIKGELELSDIADKSIFNQHLEEILYLFECTAFDTVLIEDLDRFNNTELFTKLREINTLINHSPQITRPVRFIYAIKDELFRNKNERVKFFDYIIPVIPYINPGNAGDQITRLIQEAGLQGSLSPSFTSDVVAFIDDIDMRLLINIFHEYKLYSSILSSELKQDNLFAMVVYKNLYPDDFGNLQRRKGFLFDFFNKKKEYLRAIREQHDQEVAALNEELRQLEKERNGTLKELRAIYVTTFIAQLENFHSFDLGQEVSPVAALEDHFFNELRSDKAFFYNRYVHQAPYDRYIRSRVRSAIRFSDIEKKIPSKHSYAEREKLVTDKLDNRDQQIKTRRETLVRANLALETLTVAELLTKVDKEEYLDGFRDNPLMRNLLLNGHIDEQYEDYISLFHGINLTQDDFKFERHVRSRTSLPFDFKLSRLDNLVRKLPVHYFPNEEILNFSLLDYLLANEANHPEQLDGVFQRLAERSDKVRDFICSCLQGHIEAIDPFVARLCERRPSLWVDITETWGLPDLQIRAILPRIFNNASLDALLKLDNRHSLERWIAEMPDPFAFVASLQQPDRFQGFIERCAIELEQLDMPGHSQAELFQWIYLEAHYALNPHNIAAILRAHHLATDAQALATALYTTLKTTGLNDLLEHIDCNQSEFIENVLLKMPRNSAESEATLVGILNREDVSLELKTRLLQTQAASVSTLEDIASSELKQAILAHNKLQPTWENLIHYFEQLPERVMDDTLVTYLNKAENYDRLADQQLATAEEEGVLLQFTEQIVLCNRLGLAAYTTLLNSMACSFESLPIAELDSNKVRSLITRKVLRLTESNFSSLKAKDPGLSLMLLETHQDKFVQMATELPLTVQDWQGIFQSENFSLPNKVLLVKEVPEPLIAEHQTIAKMLGELAPLNKSYQPGFATLVTLIDAQQTPDPKMLLINHSSSWLTDDQLQQLISLLGEDYPTIFQKKHRPTYAYSQPWEDLLKTLQERNLIIRYVVDTENREIRVIANH